MPDWLTEINAVLWVSSNVLVGYITLAVYVFIIGYYALFNPRATTAGRLLFNLLVSLAFVMTLVFIGVFIDNRPDEDWLSFRGDTLWWRPSLRIMGYGFLAYAVTALIVFLAKVKWFPHLLKTSRDKELIRLRHERAIDNGNS